MSCWRCEYRRLLDLGLTKDYINDMIKEKAITEIEGVFGTLYGPHGDANMQENM